MTEKHGNLSINSENIFPIIKKWMYSDQDIFFRELVSNGCDAITKLKLEMMGEYEAPEDQKSEIHVICDPENKTLKFIDNGLGMTAEEVEEYINQIAFSGATDFIEKYKDKANEDQIIGHFGLGFYSAFMVADEVHIDTLSFKKGEKAVHWECDGGTEFDMKEGQRDSVGTTITLFMNEDCLQYCNEYKAREVLKKYCGFMPYAIYLEKAGQEEKPESEEAEKKEPKPVNDTNPLWTRNASECTREDYLEFYRKTFNDYKEPLFWIHLNMDYPFNLKGILYFPKINLEYESIEGTIKLYNNQVFVADNIKEVIPEFLLLLKGVIDCPDLPLNVSRSALQNDGFVNKISEYITKKVADKLSGMCKTDKEEYEKYWDDISPFIKFGCLKDDKFCEKMTDYVLFKNLDGKYVTLPECLEVKPIDPDEQPEETEEETAEPEDHETDGEDEREEKHKTVYYVTDEVQQSQYIQMFKKAGMDAVILTENIDQPFVQQLESKNEGVRFERIDAGIGDAMKSKVGKKAGEELKAQAEVLTGLLSKVLKKDGVKVELQKLKNKNVAGMLTVSEDSRRMQDMMKMYARRMPGMDMGPESHEGETLIVNANHPLVQKVLENPEGENARIICEQIYDLARISNAPLDAESMSKFIERSNKIMLLLG